MAIDKSVWPIGHGSRIGMSSGQLHTIRSGGLWECIGAAPQLNTEQTPCANETDGNIRLIF